MLEAVIEGILTNHNEIKHLTKYLNKLSSIVYISTIANTYIIYKTIKTINKQDIQISELKKELEEIKTKGE